MVDPKRHINVLSEEDQIFLNECEEEFKDRFTENDTEFQAYCAQAAPPPPVLEPWNPRNFHGGGQGGFRGGRGRYDEPGQYNSPGRFHHQNRNRDYRDRPYHYSHRGENRYGNNRGRYNDRNHRR
ncbi:RNA guanine-N7 methyltransferase activating subunit [Malaya genurostris]|uniref:RNA guanine-N7 methyltransferase activating subunit n=1 Tax=Malaya genurostris TaxID=325434 RepID=UPI0026F37E6E|nr:RNA guanine-N7 methyltransferase activating subunit [Malaya genurostris]